MHTESSSPRVTPVETTLASYENTRAVGIKREKWREEVEEREERKEGMKLSQMRVQIKIESETKKYSSLFRD